MTGWLDAVAAHYDAFDVGLTGDGWVPLTMAIDEEWVAGRVARLAEGGVHGRRPRAVAGAYFGGDLTWRVVTAAVLVLHAEHRALDVSLDNLAVRIDDEGWPSRLAVIEERFACLAGDPAAAAPGVDVVVDQTGLVGRLADAIVAAMEPVLTIIGRVGRYGQAGLWGTLADHVANVAWQLKDADADAAELDLAWSTTEELLDAIGAGLRWLKVRPRRFSFTTDDGPVHLPMRGTCCLYYQTPEAGAAEGDGLCSTCPRRTDPERIALVETLLHE